MQRKYHFSPTTTILASEGPGDIPHEITEGATLECRTGREPCPCPIGQTPLCPHQPLVGSPEVESLAVLGFHHQSALPSPPWAES